MKPLGPIPTGFSPRPMVICLQPGQSVTIVAVDENGRIPPNVAGATLTAADSIRMPDRPRRSPDSPRRSPDSPRRSPDSLRRV